MTKQELDDTFGISTKINQMITDMIAIATEYQVPVDDYLDALALVKELTILAADISIEEEKIFFRELKDIN